MSRSAGPVTMRPRAVSQRRWTWRVLAPIAIGLAAILATIIVSVGAWEPTVTRVFPTSGASGPVAAVYFSGDMGLRLGTGRYVESGLAAHGITTFGMSSAALFHTRRTRDEVNIIVASAVRNAIEQAGVRRVILIGQSFGADMIATALPSLPADLRSRTVGVILIVPGRTAYFRADPSGLVYRGVPDAKPALALRGVSWTPIGCIGGTDEGDSLCPALGRAARTVMLPGGHFLNNDHLRIVATVLGLIHEIAPGVLRERAGDHDQELTRGSAGGHERLLEQAGEQQKAAPES